MIDRCEPRVMLAAWQVVADGLVYQGGNYLYVKQGHGPYEINERLRRQFDLEITAFEARLQPQLPTGGYVVPEASYTSSNMSGGSSAVTSAVPPTDPSRRPVPPEPPVLRPSDPFVEPPGLSEARVKYPKLPRALGLELVERESDQSSSYVPVSFSLGGAIQDVVDLAAGGDAC